MNTKMKWLRMFKRKSPIDQIYEAITQYAHRPEEDLNRRIKELNHERNAEQFIKVNASVLAGLGVVLALFFNRKWLILPGLTLALFLRGNGPKKLQKPTRVLWGVRSKREIEAEKQALRTLLESAH